MKVYLKYIDKLDPNYILVPLDYNRNNKLYSKEEIVNVLEANKFEVSKTKTIRFYNREYCGWEILRDNNEIIPKKIMIELNRSYKTDKFIPKIEEMLVKIETVMAQMRVLILKSIINQNSKVKKGIVILTSSPLKYESIIHENNITMNNYYNPVNYEASLSNIIDATKAYNLEYKYGVLTKESLINISSCSFIPVIIHIYCFSGYDNKGNFYLSFEDKRGNLIKGTIDDFRELNDSLTQKNKQDEPLFIIVTPHNEDAGNMLSMAGVKNYLCIHSNLINDYQERKFSKLFYESLLLKENTQNAAESVSLFMETEYKRNALFQCCCFHSHSSNCQWKNKAIDNHYACHIDHMAYYCKCKDKQFNLHKKVGCHWAKQFIDKYSPLQIKNPKNKKICCCSIDLPHDKVIQIKYSFGTKASAPLNNLVKIDRKDCRVTNSCLNLSFSLNLITSLHGRNSIVYDIISYFIDSNINSNDSGGDDSNSIVCKCISLNGQRNEGKKELAKYCGIYLYEREYVSDVIILNDEKCISDQAIISLISKNDANEIEKQINILLIIIISTNIAKIKQYLPIVQSQYPNIKYLLVNESESPIALGRQIKVDLLQLSEISNLINELDSTINSLDTSSSIMPGCFSEYNNLLMETEGKFYKIFLLSKTFNDKKGSISISELQKVIKENTDTIDTSFIKSDPRKLELLYLLQFSGNGFSFNDLDFFLYPVPIELLFDMFPIVIKRTREDEDFFQIQSSFISFITKTIKIPQAIKVKVKLMLIIKFSMIYRYLIDKKSSLITDFSAQLNYGMWKSLTSPSEINLTCLARLNDKRKLMFGMTLLKRVFIKETLKQLFDNKDIDQIELKKHIEDISISIPTLFHFKENIDSLNLIKYFSRLLENFDNFEFAKGRLYLLFAFFHSNVGISTYENFILEEEQIKKAIWYFKILSHNEGLGECYFFSSVNKFNCRSFINPSTDYISDINIAMKYYSKHLCDSIGFARCAYQASFYDLDHEIINKNNVDNVYKALDIFAKEKNSNSLYWQLRTLLLISKTWLLLEEYEKSKTFFDKGNNLLTKSYEEDIKQLYKEHENKINNKTFESSNRLNTIRIIESLNDNYYSDYRGLITCSYKNILMNAFRGINNTKKAFEIKYDILDANSLNFLLKETTCSSDILVFCYNANDNNDFLNSIVSSCNNEDSNKSNTHEKNNELYFQIKKSRLFKSKLLFLIVPNCNHDAIINTFIQFGFKNSIVIITKEKQPMTIKNQCIIAEFFQLFFSLVINDIEPKEAYEFSMETLIIINDFQLKDTRIIYYSNDNILSPPKLLIQKPNDSETDSNNHITHMQINVKTNISSLIDTFFNNYQITNTDQGKTTTSNCISKNKEATIKRNCLNLLLRLNQLIIDCNDIIFSINTNTFDSNHVTALLSKCIIVQRNEVDIIITINSERCDTIDDILDLYNNQISNVIKDTKNNTIHLKIIILITNVPLGLISNKLLIRFSHAKLIKNTNYSIISNIVIAIVSNQDRKQIEAKVNLNLFKEYIGELEYDAMCIK